MRLRIMIPVITAIVMSYKSTAQVFPFSDQYILNPVLINPATTGTRGSINISAFYRRQWAGIEGAPETLTLAADAPLAKSNTGLGLSLVLDKAGVTREMILSSSYSYKIEAGDGILSLGLKAGIISRRINWSELSVLDPGDELYTVDSKTYTLPDFGFGAFFSSGPLFAGFSVPRLLGYQFNYEKNRYSLKINPVEYYYMFYGGWLFNFSGNIKYMPSTLISLSPHKKVLVDLNSHFSFSEKIWFGATFTSSGSAGGLFQFAVTNQVKITYSYHVDFGKLARYSHGSHEIMLRFDFHYKADVVNPLIF